jgi:hypothetical protein
MALCECGPPMVVDATSTTLSGLDALIVRSTLT